MCRECTHPRHVAKCSQTSCASCRQVETHLPTQLGGYWQWDCRHEWIEPLECPSSCLWRQAGPRSHCSSILGLWEVDPDRQVSGGAWKSNILTGSWVGGCTPPKNHQSWVSVCHTYKNYDQLLVWHQTNRFWRRTNYSYSNRSIA